MKLTAALLFISIAAFAAAQGDGSDGADVETHHESHEHEPAAHEDSDDGAQADDGAAGGDGGSANELPAADQAGDAGAGTHASADTGADTDADAGESSSSFTWRGTLGNDVLAIGAVMLAGHLGR